MKSSDRCLYVLKPTVSAVCFSLTAAKHFGQLKAALLVPSCCTQPAAGTDWLATQTSDHNTTDCTGLQAPDNIRTEHFQRKIRETFAFLTRPDSQSVFSPPRINLTTRWELESSTRGPRPAPHWSAQHSFPCDDPASVKTNMENVSILITSHVIHCHDSLTRHSHQFPLLSSPTSGVLI